MKPLVKKETVTTVQNCLNDFKPKYSLEKYKFNNFEIFTFGEAQVTKTGDEYYVYYLENVGKDYCRAWNKDVGKVMCRLLRKKQYDKLYEFKTDSIKALLRIVDEEEKPDFESFETISYVKFGDKEYILLTMIPLHSSYSSKDLSSCDIDDIISDDEKYAADEDDDYVYKEEPEPESYSLF